ncbi:uncharacterized protein LOC102797715 isoform X2 [Neolamprologus brichardi]|uniref:uncharacterized protein LOC102797715 isoform X2 n=1 Tax=Neolamprologus brichardi TaxID=32507 RepID=UPI0016439510|nr:uncharacterized protein LOC102797715 isoform X2 [Neolamprologus brichardi]XP_035771638.1 uncharacterized protein LOC102797715 isoform X2 [Neolamprologus brichardi]XP_035771639.1 uncharacterized protein LOC102797715 isoform X2 [Neolamprologus brichardi]
MLCPLLFLSALTALAGAQWSYQQTFSESSVLNIRSCAITYYGQKYEQLYVNITSGNVTVCFNGFFSPETGSDCIVEHSRGAQRFQFLIIQDNSLENENENLATIQNSLECTVFILFPSNIVINLYLDNFGTQAALGVSTSSSDPVRHQQTDLSKYCRSTR